MITRESADSRLGIGEPTLAPLSRANMRAEAGAYYQALKQGQSFGPPPAIQYPAGFPDEVAASRIAALLAERRAPCDVRLLGDQL